MNVRDDDDYCINCNEKNTVIYSICCKCKYNNSEYRPATKLEIKNVNDKIKFATNCLRQALEN